MLKSSVSRLKKLQPITERISNRHRRRMGVTPLYAVPIKEVAYESKEKNPNIRYGLHTANIVFVLPVYDLSVVQRPVHVVL